MIVDYTIPFVISVKTIVVADKTTPLRTWAVVCRNVRADFRRLHGEEPQSVTGLRFQVNSQHTKSRARGCISEIEFRD